MEVERKNHLKSRQKDFLLLSCCLESMNSVHIQNIPNHIDFLSSHHLCQTIQQGQLQSEVTLLFPLSTSSVVTANVPSSNTHLLCVCFHNHHTLDQTYTLWSPMMVQYYVILQMCVPISNCSLNPRKHTCLLCVLLLPTHNNNNDCC